MEFDQSRCELCPRRCGADRTQRQGLCGGGGLPRVARAALHHWEEPCISGTSGSGTVFFSGCPLRCCFCQNYRISAQNFGVEVTPKRLAEIFRSLQEQGAHNINLVNPTQYLPWILEALDRADLSIPVVYNSGGYERVETLRALEGYVDVYLPDLKYIDSSRSQRYSGAPDYFEAASSAIIEMHRQVGKPQFKDGLLQRGMIVRHLVLPKGREDSFQVLNWLSEQFSPDEFLISVMSQYTPYYRSAEFPEINRRIFSAEYNSVVDCANRLGLEGYLQEKSSAKEEYTPPFDLEGIF